MSGTCDVTLGDYDGEAADFCVTATPRARKPHRCYECEATIAAGDRYVKVSGKWEGRFDTTTFCAACWEILNEFSEGAVSWGNLWPEMRENWDEGAHITACIQRVSTVAAKTKLRAQWQKWRGL